LKNRQKKAISVYKHVLGQDGSRLENQNAAQVEIREGERGQFLLSGTRRRQRKGEECTGELAETPGVNREGIRKYLRH